jgi:hypothetical protein
MPFGRMCHPGRSTQRLGERGGGINVPRPGQAEGLDLLLPATWGCAMGIGRAQPGGAA